MSVESVSAIIRRCLGELGEATPGEMCEWVVFSMGWGEEEAMVEVMKALRSMEKAGVVVNVVKNKWWLLDLEREKEILGMRRKEFRVGNKRW